jgi:hypothetical protein
VRRLSAYDIVRLLEWGDDKHPVDRALALVRAALPELGAEQATRLPIGRRDAVLLALREATFGARLEIQARCPACAEVVEFSATTAELRVDGGGEGQGGEVAGVRYRLPDSTDLAAVAGERDLARARERILARCVEGGPARLDPELRAALASRMSEQDPQADVTFRLRCACGETWRVVFDIGSFLWTELEAERRSLLREVHALARAYGWPEPYILSMSSRRRAHYLEMCGNG